MNIQSSKMKNAIPIKDKKEAVLNAAMSLIAEQGFHAAPMSLIASRAGVAAGTIYHYFASKEDMIIALYARSKERMGAALLSESDPNSPYKQRFNSFWLNLFVFFTEHPADFMFLQQYSNSPFIAQHTREENEVFYQPVIVFLEEGIRMGVLRPMHIQLLVALVYGTVVATVQLHLSCTLRVEGQHLIQALASAWDAVQSD
jgi:AcrR family transcriptional regulator